MIAVVAINKRGVIGHEGGIPWPMNRQDMRHFVALTNEARQIIVGRKTWESLPPEAQARLLKRSVMIVTSHITRSCSSPNISWVSPQCVGSFRWDAFPEDRGICVIGGAQTYALFAPAITTWHVTELDNDLPGDTTLTPYWQGRETFGLYASRIIDGGVIRTYRRWM